MRRSFTIAVLCSLLLALAGAQAASAAVICWDGPSSGAWSTAANWAGDVVPGSADIAVLDNDEPGNCAVPTSVSIAGESVTAGLVKQAPGTTIVVDGGGMGRGLTLTGDAGALPIQVLGDVDVRSGGHLTIGEGASIYAGGAITLGAGLPGNGTVNIDGALTVVTDQFSILEPTGGGRIAISATGALVLAGGTAAVVAGQLDNQGAIRLRDQSPIGTNLGSLLTIRAANETPPGAGTISIQSLSTLALLPTRGGAMAVAGGGAIFGDGALQLGSSPGPGTHGTLTIGTGATLDVGKLTISGDGALDLRTAGTTDALVLAAGDGRRGGSERLTAGSAQIQGGHLLEGVTEVTGQVTISGGTASPAVHDGATLLTGQQSTTTWATGALTLGGAGAPGTAATWQNAGTLTIGGTTSLLADGDNGVLNNIDGATIIRDTPGTMLASARITNAGTITMLAGSVGTAATLSEDAADLVQTGGATRVAAGATLAMDVTLAGGTLSGTGTVRTLANGGGTVAPGAPPGTLSVEGDYAQAAAGTLAVDIAGASAGQFDRLLVGETAELDGTLAITTAAGYGPARNTGFRIIQAKARSGAFAQLTGAQAAGSSYLAQNLTDGTQLCFGCGPPGTFELTVTLSGAGTGTVTSEPAGITCGADCAHDIAGGAIVTLTAVPVAGSVFAGWSGVCEGRGPCLVTMDQTRDVTATFAPEPPPEPPAPGGSAATTPTSRSTAAAKTPVSNVVSFPSAKSCRRSTALSLRLRMPRGVTANSARVTVAGKARTVRGSALTRPFKLRLLRGRSVKVQVAVTLGDGRVVRDARVYRVCASR